MTKLNAVIFDFISDEYFDIINLSSKEELFQFIYEANLNVLNDQIKKDEGKLNDLLEPFIQKINIKNKNKEENTRSVFEKSLNYFSH